MAGLKDGDDFRSGERFKGAGMAGVVSLAAGAVAIVLFAVFALAGGGSNHDHHPDPGAGMEQVADQGDDCAAGGEEENAGEHGTEGYSRRDAMAYSWLFAVVFFLSLSVGGLFWTLLHHATNSGWGTVVRRLMENLAMLIPFMLLLAVPLIFPQFGFRDQLWEWFPERQAAETAAAEHAEAKLESYRAELQEKADKAKAEVEKTKGEKAAIQDISPGHARFFDDKIRELEKEAADLAEHAAQNEEAIFEELKAKEFKHGAALLYAKRDYLDGGFWLLRFFLYVLILGGAAFFLRSLSLKQDRTGDPGLFTKMRGASCLLLLPFAISWTFLVFDWLMALDYSWFSTMWGVYLFAGAALNSMGVLILTMSWLRSRGHLGNVITKEHYHIMGKLMHAFVIFWAYIAFSQFFLIWYANITEETKFFLTRNTGFWNFYSIAFLVAGHFFIPFVALLIRKFKTTTWIICTVAIWNLLMHFFDIYWIVIAERAPSLTEGALNRIPGMWKYDLLAFVGVGGIFVFLLLKMLGSASLFPCRDPRLDESLNLTN